MKIRALEIEEGGKVTRYTGRMEVESSWPVPEAGSFKYEPENYGKPGEAGYPYHGKGAVVVGGARCECSHLESEHLPECIYKVEGCECEGYKGAESPLPM